MMTGLVQRVAIKLGLMRRPPPPQPAVFDSGWYCAQRPGAPDKPWEHYATAGWREGLSPSPLFDAARYLRLYPDVLTAGQEPLWHYLTLGWREDRSPHSLFDPAWYGQQRRFDVDPLTDYLAEGWRSGCSPHKLFHVAHYRTRRVGPPGRADLVDYLCDGWRQGFDPHPYFSLAHYTAQVASAGDPLTDYVDAGYRSHSPHPDFDPVFYRERYLLSYLDPPDPLADFVTTGWVLDRAPSADAPADWRDTALRLLGPLSSDQSGSRASSPTA